MSVENKVDVDFLVPVLIQGLQGPTSQALVKLTLDFLLAQPLKNIVPVALLQKQTVLLLQTIVQSQQTQEWMVQQIDALKAVVPSGVPSDYVPSSIQEPLRRALQQEIPVDTDLVHQLMNHPAMEQLFHDVLSSVLLDFTETLKTLAQTATSMTSSFGAKSSGGLGGFGRLKALGEKVVQNSPIGQITQIIEQQAQQKILQFLDQSIASIIRRSANEIGKVENRSQQAQYRIHVLDVLLSTENQRLMQQLNVFETAFLVETGIQTVQAMLELPSFQEQLQTGLLQILDTIGDQSVQDFLVASDLGENWRADVEEYFVSVAQQIFAQEGFANILSSMLSGETGSSKASGH